MAVLYSAKTNSFRFKKLAQLCNGGDKSESKPAALYPSDAFPDRGFTQTTP